jgi:hypothetical protein
MRGDSFPLGFLLGLLFPVLGFFGYGGIYVTAIRPHHDIHWFVHDLFLGTSEYRSQIISLSLIADAFLFFGFDRYEKYKSMRGVIAAMLLYGIVVVAFLF